MKQASRKFRVFICLVGALAAASSASAAVGEQLWVRRHIAPGDRGANAFDIAADELGNVFVTGSSSGVAGASLYVTIKYSDKGFPLWTNRYQGPGRGLDDARALALDSNGNVIVTGASLGSGSFDYATVKYSGTGVPLWTNRQGVLGHTAGATAVAVDGNDNVVVTGYSDGSGLATIKYSSAGVALWTNRYFGPYFQNHYGSAIAVDANGNVFVTGYSPAGSTGDDFVTLAYLANGAPRWTNRFNGTGNGSDTANAIVLDGSGNVYVTGGTFMGGVSAFATIKYSNTGIPRWTNYYRGPGNSPYGGAGSIAVDPADNVVITGTSLGITTYQDFTTLKYSNTGVPLWTNRFNRLYDDVAIALATDMSGNVFVTGYSMDENLRYDVLTVAYSSTGARLWTNRYAGPGGSDDSGNAIAVDTQGNVLVTGYSFGTNDLPDIATIKYAGVQPVPLTIQRAGNRVVLTWPNPTFRLQAATNVNRIFTDVSGATSPYTNSMTESQRYFRLRLN